LPNYLVGAVLRDRDSEGAVRVRALIKSRRGVSPARVAPPRTFFALYGRGRDLAFGKSGYLLCPYFDEAGGICSIWENREAVCATYFCKHVAGEPGKRFWDAVRMYLQHVQRSLAIYLMYSLDVAGAPEVADRFMTAEYETGKLTASDLDHEVSESDYSALWASWYEKEEEFFVACAERAEHLSPEEFGGVAGVEAKLALDRVLRSFAATEIPPRIKFKTESQLGVSGNSYIVNLTHAQLTLAVPRVVLHAFDGKAPTAAVCQRLREQSRMAVEDELIYALYHAGVFVSA